MRFHSHGLSMLFRSLDGVASHSPLSLGVLESFIQRRGRSSTGKFQFAKQKGLSLAGGGFRNDNKELQNLVADELRAL